VVITKELRAQDRENDQFREKLTNGQHDNKENNQTKSNQKRNLSEGICPKWLATEKKKMKLKLAIEVNRNTEPTTTWNSVHSMIHFRFSGSDEKSDSAAVGFRQRGSGLFSASAG
jgi:hypothetical protein